LSATKQVAASELPPPKPPPMGMRLSTLMSAPKELPAAACSVRAARTQDRLLRDAGKLGDAVNPPVGAHLDRDLIAQIDELKTGLQFVIPVGPPAQDM